MNTKITTILAIIGVTLASCTKEESTIGVPLSGGYYEGKVKSISIDYNNDITEEQVGTTVYNIISNEEGLIPEDVTYTYFYNEESGNISSIAVDKSGKEERYTYSYPSDRSISINYYKDDMNYPEDVYEIMTYTAESGYDLVSFYRAEKDRRNCIITNSTSYRVTTGREYITIGSWYAHNSQYDVTWSSNNVSTVERGDGTTLSYSYTTTTAYYNKYSVDINEMITWTGTGGYLVDCVAMPALKAQIGDPVNTTYGSGGTGMWSRYLVSSVSDYNTEDSIITTLYTFDDTTAYPTEIAVSTYEIVATEAYDENDELYYEYSQSAISYSTITIEYYVEEVEEEDEDTEE